MDACLAFHLDYYLWEIDEYPRWFKVKVLAGHHMRQVIANHIEDAKAQAIKNRKQK